MRFPSDSLYITATDTEAGKTVVSAALIAELARRGERVAGMKPIASGCERTPEGLRNADALALQQAGNVDVPYGVVNPYAFAPAIAPEFAADAEGTAIEIAAIESAFAGIGRQADRIVVEGFGGWLSPIDARQDQADLVQALGLAVVLVVPLRVGCIHQARATAMAIVQSGVRFAGWIANGLHGPSDQDAGNVAAIRRYLGAPLLATVTGDSRLRMEDVQ